MRNSSKDGWILIIFILHVLLLPFTFILYLIGRRQLKDLFEPVVDVWIYLTSRHMTLSLILCTSAITTYAWIIGLEAFVVYPQTLLEPSQYYRFFSHGFAHSSIPHLAGNMLALLAFGRVVEARLGPARMFGLYMFALLVAGIGASAINLWLGHTAGGVGASGAIMGLLAAALLLDPFKFTAAFIIPLPIMIVGWLNIYSDITGVLSPEPSNIGYLAHICGYISVAIFTYFATRQEKHAMRTGLIVNIISLILAATLWIIFGQPAIAL